LKKSSAHQETFSFKQKAEALHEPLPTIFS
jgi:hypothetical protein